MMETTLNVQYMYMYMCTTKNGLIIYLASLSLEQAKDVCIEMYD